MIANEVVEPGVQQRLTSEERAIAERLAQEQEVIARRARLLLAWDDGLSRAEIIERSRLSPRRVRYWLRIFPEQRLGIFPGRVLEMLSEGGSANGLVSPLAEGIPTDRPRGSFEHVELLEKPGIEPDDPMSEAGRKILRFHFRRMIHQEPGTRAGEDVDALHDMRVATRRMRAAFRVFGDYYDPEFVAPYLKGLKRTGRTLGAVRDLDVFREKARAYVRTLSCGQEQFLDDFLAVLEGQREKARQSMIAYLDSEEYRRFVERFGEFVETKASRSLPISWKSGEPRPYRVRHVVPMTIYERLAAVRAYDEWLSVPNPPLTRFHALRIASKRLRYTLEFFAEVLGPDTDALIEEVVAMQDHLGDLQDAVVASAILRDFLMWGTWGHDADDKSPPQPEAPVFAPGVAAYLAAKQLEMQHLLNTFPEGWERLTGACFSRMVAEAVVVL